MTATDELRRMLDERWVYWWAGEDERKTLWESNGLTWEYFNDENGDAWLGFLGACDQDVTPEQAIAATLGKEPDDAATSKLHDRMNAALLEYERALGSEKADGAITVPFVTKMHQLLEEAATLGVTDASGIVGTCHADETDTMECVCDGIGHYGKPLTVHVMECSECGHTYEHVNGSYEYCPRCGAKVIG